MFNEATGEKPKDEYDIQTRSQLAYNIEDGGSPGFYVLMRDDKITAAVWVFLFAEFTDVLDGIIARKFNLETPFGKIADPVADKMMQLTALFVLGGKDMIPAIIPYLVLFKELFLLISGLYLIRKNIDMSSKWFGKLTSVLFFVAIMMAFLGVSGTLPCDVVDMREHGCIRIHHVYQELL